MAVNLEELIASQTGGAATGGSTPSVKVASGSASSAKSQSGK